MGNNNKEEEDNNSAILDDSDEIELTPEQKKKKMIKYIIIAAIILVILIIAIIYWHSHSKVIILKISDAIHSLVNENRWYTNILFCLSIMAFNFLLMPGMILYQLVLVVYMRSFFRPYFIFLIGKVVGSHLCFLAIRYKFKEFMEKKIKKKKLFRAINYEVEKNPWMASVIMSMLLIPLPFKNYSLPLTKMTFVQFSIPMSCFFAMYSGIIIHVGLKMHEIKELFEEKKFS